MAILPILKAVLTGASELVYFYITHKKEIHGLVTVYGVGAIAAGNMICIGADRLGYDFDPLEIAASTALDIATRVSGLAASFDILGWLLAAAATTSFQSIFLAEKIKAAVDPMRHALGSHHAGDNCKFTLFDHWVVLDD